MRDMHSDSRPLFTDCIYDVMQAQYSRLDRGNATGTKPDHMEAARGSHPDSDPAAASSSTQVDGTNVVPNESTEIPSRPQLEGCGEISDARAKELRTIGLGVVAMEHELAALHTARPCMESMWTEEGQASELRAKIRKID